MFKLMKMFLFLNLTIIELFKFRYIFEKKLSLKRWSLISFQ